MGKSHDYRISIPIFMLFVKKKRVTPVITLNRNTKTNPE